MNRVALALLAATLAIAAPAAGAVTPARYSHHWQLPHNEDAAEASSEYRATGTRCVPHANYWQCAFRLVDVATNKTIGCYDGWFAPDGALLKNAMGGDLLVAVECDQNALAA